MGNSLGGSADYLTRFLGLAGQPGVVRPGQSKTPTLSMGNNVGVKDQL